ncbi:O-antigen polymerase [Aequorivita sp. CIP111184]|uniref:O-antigen polymerase n=1 Tax=Aequorivita sp. CIP111184 TaxID=2211356 RepID=UPI000DBBC111|nr:O-antigen polymerase [Aequorivita sp. CIP111184]SRX54897.1 hypothetical protein AEQU1_01917 [Aequorivita sp. CIP111184]
MIILIIFYILIGVFFFVSLLRRLRKDGWSLFTYSCIYLFLFYIVSPIISLSVYNYEILSGLNIAYIVPDQGNTELMTITFFCICLGIIFFFLGYNRRVNIRIIAISPKFFGRQRLPQLYVSIIFLFSLAGLYFYVTGFGSLSNAIENANLVRSGYYISVEDGDTAHTFFFRFIFLAIIPLLFFYFNKNLHNVVRFFIIITSLIVLSILYLYLSPGRQSILDLILIFLFSAMLKRKEIFNLKILILGFVFLLFLPILDFFFSNRSLASANYSSSIFEILLNEFGFPYYSLSYSIKENYSYFVFSDFVSGTFGKIIPSSWNPGIVGSNYLNSFYMVGVSVKSIPPGIFAQGFYSLGFIGIILVSYFTGFLFKVFDVTFKQVSAINADYIYIYAYFIVSSMIWIRTGLPANYFYNFTFILFLIFFFTTYKIQRQKQ